MRPTALVAALCMLVSPALAQDVAAAKKECAEIRKEIDAAYAAYREAFAKVRDSDEYKIAYARYKASQYEDEGALATLRRLADGVPRPDMADFAPRFAVGALANAGTNAAVPYLEWLSSRGGPELARGAVSTLIASHTASPLIGDIAEGIHRLGYVVGRDRARELATAIIDHNADDEIKAAAYFGRGSNYGVRKGREVVLTDEEEMLKQADIAACVKLAPGSISALRAAAPTFEKERLQIGMVSPDITGKDVDGVQFKLSDYRGKVVVLDFWGDW